MLKEKIRESEKELSQHQCRWQNIIFGKDGTSMRGLNLFDTQQQAESRMQLILSGTKAASERGLLSQTETADGQFLMENYAWHIQMPVLTN